MDSRDADSFHYWTEIHLLRCVCGCGRRVPKESRTINLVALMVALEIAEWDNYRTLMRFLFELKWWTSPIPEAEIGTFVAGGLNVYEAYLAVLHGDANRFDPYAARRWERQSRKERKRLAKLGAPLEGQKNLWPTDRNMQWLNGKHPNRSYSGSERLTRLMQDAIERF